MNDLIILTTVTLKAIQSLWSFWLMNTGVVAFARSTYSRESWGNCSLAIRVELRLGEFGTIHCGSNVFQHEHISQALQFIDALEGQDLEYSEYWMAIAEHSQPLPPSPTFRDFYQYVLQRCQIAIEDYHELFSFYVTDRRGYLEIVHGAET